MLFFTQEVACQYCRETEQILREFSELSDKITLEVYNFVNDKVIAEQFGIDKIPAIVVMGEKDYGIRFFGIPSGYEFTTLIEDVVNVSRGDPNLSQETIETLNTIDEPVHIQVFITPTCPYCPTAVRLAHSMAMVNENIRADMVEAIEFPHLANKYQVYGVPRTVINEKTHLEGAVPENIFLAKVLEGIGRMTSAEVDKLIQDLMSQRG